MKKQLMPKRKHFSVEEIAEFLEKSVGDVTDFILYSQVLRGAVITKKVLTGSESGLTRYWSSDDGNNGERVGLSPWAPYRQRERNQYAICVSPEAIVNNGWTAGLVTSLPKYLYINPEGRKNNLTSHFETFDGKVFF